MASLWQRLQDRQRSLGARPPAGASGEGEESLIELAERLVADAQLHAESARKLAQSADVQLGAAERRSAAPGPDAARGVENVTRASDELAAGAQKLAQAAFALDLKVKFARSTNTFRAWQQVPAWGLGVAGLALAFYLASRGDDFDSFGAWTTVIIILVLAVITMFRGPADLSLGTGSGAAAGGQAASAPKPPAQQAPAQQEAAAPPPAAPPPAAAVKPTADATPPLPPVIEERRRRS